MLLEVVELVMHGNHAHYQYEGALANPLECWSAKFMLVSASIHIQRLPGSMHFVVFCTNMTRMRHVHAEMK